MAENLILNKISQANDKNEKYCIMIASSMASIIKMSLNNNFREKTLALINLTDTSEMENTIYDMLMNLIYEEHKKNRKKKKISQDNDYLDAISLEWK